MDSSERRGAIIARLGQAHSVTVAELAQLSECSEMTVRRDLEALEGAGVLRRVHGGAVSMLTGEEPPYAARRLQATKAKARIGHAAAQLLRDAETVAIDCGTTPLEVALAVRGRRLTVTPLSVQAIAALSADDTVELLLTGGRVRPGEGGLVGELAEAAFDRLRYDTFVLGCCGIAADGFTGHNLDDVRVKRAAMRSARRVIAVADASKLGRVAFGEIAPNASVDVLVTDADPAIHGPEVGVHLEALRAAGVEVISA